MFLLFDTETTGLPQNWGAPVSDSRNWPRMVQLAWELWDENQQQISAHDYIIYPEDYKIPADVARIHGITTERAMAEGRDLNEVLDIFVADMNKATQLVAHNISFDEKILGAEFYRKKSADPLPSLAKVCTMKSSTNFCQIPSSRGYKWPNLTELHKILFGTGFDKAHSAGADVGALVRCFWGLKEKGVL